MSYLVIARKRRPQTFEEVLGQPHVTRTLQNAVRSGRIAHAYLFTGARGVGKTSVARVLAKALNCGLGTSPVPCNECSNCREITAGNAVDVLEIDGASNRGIDNIRELRETVRYRPAKSRFKIYIIDEVHMLTTEAFNALLKTLEEPPDHVVFIFATTEPHKIPATILSRCQRFDFRRIPTELLAESLKNIAALEKAGLSENVLYSIAREADGSMRDAQSLLEQLIAFSGEGLEDEEVLDVLGVVDRRSVYRAADSILKGDVGACLDVVEDLYRRGIDSRRFCSRLCEHFRNLLFVSLGDSGGKNRLSLPEEERRLLAENALETTPDSLYLYFQAILKGEEDIRRSSMPRIGLEMLLLRLSQLPRLETLSGVSKKLEQLERSLKDGRLRTDESPIPVESAPVEGPEADRPESKARAEAAGIRTVGKGPDSDERGRMEGLSPPFPVGVPGDPAGEAPGERKETPAFSPSDIAERWPEFLRSLHEREPVLAAMLQKSRIGGVSEGAVEVFALEIFEEQLKGPQNTTRLNEAAMRFFGRGFDWAIRRNALQSESGDSHKAKRSRAAPGKVVLEHPMVLQALEILGGELVDIRRLKPDKGEGRKGRTPPNAGEFEKN